MKNIIGIVHETKSDFERRTPLVPADVAELIKTHRIDIRIQPSPQRIFPMKDYLAAGAKEENDLHNCDVLLGIKEVKPNDLLAGKTYLYFSHTIKGQDYNMPMLQRLLDLNCTLIDYERIADEDGRRLIFFSVQAGQSGIVETLRAYGLRLRTEGIGNPFQEIKMTFEYDGLEEVKTAFAEIGKKIKEKGLPEVTTPLVIGIAGYGNVSRGVQEVLDVLPVEAIAADNLKSFIEKGDYSRHKIYKVVFKEKDMVEPLEAGHKFELQDYYRHPENYRSIFESYLPYMDIFVNATFWDSRYPRFVTRAGLKKLYSGTPPKLRVIGDITCDVEGGIESTLYAAEPGDPVFVYDVDKDEAVRGVEGNGPVMMTVDILPSELPKNSSEYFSSVLKTFLPALAETDFSADFDRLHLPAELKRAVIVHHGELTPAYEYLQQYL